MKRGLIIRVHKPMGIKPMLVGFKFVDDSGDGLIIIATEVFGFTARHYSAETMRDSAYSFQMDRSDSIFLTIDASQSGVGGINSWKAHPLDENRLLEKYYSYSYLIQPVMNHTEKHPDEDIGINRCSISCDIFNLIKGNMK